MTGVFYDVFSSALGAIYNVKADVFMLMDTDTIIFLFQFPAIWKGRLEETRLTEDIVSVWPIASSFNLSYDPCM